MFPTLARKHIGYGLILLMLVLLIPIREYTLVPAEVISLNSEVVTAPADGVIRRILVAPDTPVVAGQVVAELDDANIKNRLALAQTRPGQQGTARITGNWSLFGCVIFRRPLATLRAWWGN